MRNKIIRYTFLSFAVILFSTACTDDFEKINTNAAAYGPTTFDPNYNLSAAQLTYTGSTDFAYDTWRSNLIYCSTMIQGLSTVVSYWAGDKYLLNEAYTASYWGTSAVGAYSEQVKPIVDVVEFTRGNEKYKNLHEVARIWRALVFARITDIYGDIPYSQAGLGYYTGVLTPKYDKQQDIYSDLLKEVEEATNNLGQGSDEITGDVIYNGDIDKWKKFGNSLLLRLAMRLSKVDPATAQAYVQKVVGKTMSSNSDNAFILHDVTGARVTQNRNSQVLLGDGGQENYYVKWSKTFIDFLKNNNDPRLGKVAVTKLYSGENDKEADAAAVSDPAVQKGMPNGRAFNAPAPEFDISKDPTFTSFPDYSSPSLALVKRNGPTFILTYAETELLLADAAQRWGIGGSASDHYNNGVKAAITYLSQYDASATIADTEAEVYLANHPYDPADGLNMINTQYWAHTNTMLDFYESWSNWRRTGLPQLTPISYPNNATGGVIPRRFPYPASEASTNNQNYQEARNSVTGGDVLTSRVWWDKE